jgi:DNA-binding MarR family transcriptional regulator
MTTEGPGQVLFEFVRYWSRRHARTDLEVDHGRLVQVTEVVASLVGRGTSATVNEVAREVGIDQSGASRLVRNAAAAGYLSLGVAETDGRRREATVTMEGEELLVQAHRWQEQVFDQLTEGWSPARRRAFHGAMADLMDQSRRLQRDS